MVIFDILQVSNDAKNLLIEAHVSEALYFEGQIITDLYITTGNLYADSIDIEKDENNVYHKSFASEEALTKVSININCNDSDLKLKDFSSDLIFVYIKVLDKANPYSGCTPCDLLGDYTIGVTFDTGLLYNIGLSYIRELADSCNIPQGFTDYILNWEGFKLLIESEHYIEAIDMYEKLFKNSGKPITSNCGCHGKVFS